MKESIWVKLVLTMSGVTVAGIGLLIMLSPQAFFAGSGIMLGENTSLLSEIRAPATALVMFGTVMLVAVFLPSIRRAALWAAALLYLSYGIGRVISVVLDGVPHSNILMALGIELSIGLICVYVLRRNPRHDMAHQ